MVLPIKGGTTRRLLFGATMRVRFRAAVLAVLLIGCDHVPTGLGSCSQDVQVTVDQTAALVFSWSPPDCAVYSLAVLESRETKWYLFTATETNRLRPGVTYGEIPSGPFRASGASQLYPGIPYRVQLTAWRSDGWQILLVDTTFAKASVVARGGDDPVS